MLKVRHGNKILRINDLQKDEYLAKGYDVIDDDGNAVEVSVPNDINVLKTAYMQHTARINELEDIIQELKKPKEESPAPKKRTTKKTEE